MDTRNKIVDWPAAAQLLRRCASGDSARRVVIGYFDPLVASHVRRLSELAAKRGLIVVIANPPQPILPARARAELVAALNAVEHVVVPPEGGLDEVLPMISEHILVREEANDARRATELIERVRNRQRL